MIYKIKELSFVEPVNQNGQITATILKGKDVFGILIFNDKFTLLKNTDIKEDYEEELKIIKIYIKKQFGYIIGDGFGEEVSLSAKLEYEVKRYDKEGNEIIENKSVTKKI